MIQIKEENEIGKIFQELNLEQLERARNGDFGDETKEFIEGSREILSWIIASKMVIMEQAKRGEEDKVLGGISALFYLAFLFGKRIGFKEWAFLDEERL